MSRSHESFDYQCQQEILGNRTIRPKYEFFPVFYSDRKPLFGQDYSDCLKIIQQLRDSPTWVVVKKSAL